MTRRTCAAIALLLSLCLAGRVLATSDTSGSDFDAPTSFSLLAAAQDDDSGNGNGNGEMSSGSEHMMYGESWDIEGPFRLRSADVQELGTWDIKVIGSYSTSSDGTDDDIGTIFQLQWGFMENNEILLSVPVEYGDGQVDGNADLYVGWQWKLCDGDDSWMPSFAVYNEVRLPSGYHSEGVDWEGRLIMTWALIPDSLRLHVNPFMAFMDPNNLETNLNRQAYGNNSSIFDPNDKISNDMDPYYRKHSYSGRYFKAGGIVGFDYRLTDTATVVVDYILDSGDLDGYGMQSSMEAGLEYQMSDNMVLAWSTNFTLDGDDQGDNWGFALSWQIALDGPRFGWGEYTMKYPRLEME